MNPDCARYVTTALTTCGVIKAIVLELIAHIDHHTLWLIELSYQGISRDKTSATVLDFKVLSRACGS
jgi:hypothetical protein